jgi:hypothetical protein
LYIYADGITKTLTSNEARWVAPIGEPSPAFAANMGQMGVWVQNLREGRPVAEVGEVIWDMSQEVLDSTDLPEQLPLGVPFAYGDTAVTLQPGGTYRRLQCNGDGITDIYVENGTLLFDFRPTTARVRAVDVTVQNYAEPGKNQLQGFNPAGIQQENLLGTVQNQESIRGWEVLSLRSEVEPFHFATLNITRGCFLGLALMPPDAPPQPAVADIPLIATPDGALMGEDNTPPYPPNALSPDGTQYACRMGDTLRVGFSWGTVMDLSGIAQYEIEAQFFSTGSEEPKAVDLPTWAAATQMVHELNCVPGRLAWRVRAVDNAGNLGEWSPWAEFGMVAQANQPPLFMSQPVTLANARGDYRYEVLALDPDGDRVQFVAEGLPPSLRLQDGGDGTAVLFGQIPLTRAGTPITLTVQDGYGGSSTQLFTVRVAIPPTPVPTGDSRLPLQFVSEPNNTAVAGDFYWYSPQVRDPMQTNDDDDDDTNQITITAPNLPRWLMLSEDNGQYYLSGTPSLAEEGYSFPITLIATSADGRTTQQGFLLTVGKRNQAPIITSEPPTYMQTSQTYQYFLQAYDPDGDTLVYRAQIHPAWLTPEVAANGLLLSGTPSRTDVGVHEVSLLVCDARGACTAQNFRLTVDPVPQ